MWLTRAALRNPILILMVSVGLVVLGATSLDRLPVDLFPNISLPVLIVGTIYQGASPEDIEKTVTYQIEKAVTSVSDVDHVQSASKDGLSIVQVWLHWGASIDSAMVEVTQHIEQIINTLPVGIQQPFVIKFDVSNLPVCDVTVAGGGLDQRALYDLAYNTIEPQLEQLSGVASATVNGGKIRQITISVDRDKMAARAVSILDVVNAVGNSNLIQPSGWVRVGKRQYNVFSNSQFRVIAHLGDIVIGSRARVPVKVRDIASVRDSFEEQTNVVRVNGRHAVYLAVNKEPGANTVEVVDRVRRRIRHLVGVAPGVRLDVTFDQSRYIRESIASLEREAAQGALLAFAVILLFLQSLRATVIVALAIPLSFMMTFLLFYFSAQTINVFTLGGLALGVGRLVDDAIVMLENMVRHFAAGERGTQAALAAAQEVSMPILASTITTVVVFLPIIFITGVAQLLFIPTALAISYALGASFLVSTTATPLLCLRYLDRAEQGRAASRSAFGFLAERARRLVAWLDSGYQRLLGAALVRRRLTMGAVLVFSLASLALVPFIGTEFFPATDESQFQVTLRAPVGATLKATERLVGEVERFIRAGMPQGTVRLMLSNVGLLTTAGKVNAEAAVYSSNTGPHAAFIQVDLAAPDRRRWSTAELVNRLRPALRAAFPQARITVSPSGIVRNVLNFGTPAPVDAEVLGYDLATGRALAEKVADAMRAVGGLSDIQVARERDFPELDVNIDRTKAALVGINERDAANAVLYSLNGNTLNPPVYTDPVTGNEYNIIVQLRPEDRSHLSDLGDIFLVNRGMGPAASVSGLPASLNLITTGVPGAGAGGALPGGGLQPPPPPLAPQAGLAGPTGQPQANTIVPLRNVASIRPGSGPLEIDRKYLQRVIDVTANPLGSDLGTVAARLRAKLAELAPTPGFTVRLGGQIAEQQTAFASLGFAAALAIALVYMVLASQFRSLLDPLIIMFTVPLGLTGVAWALFLTGTPLSVSSFMGVIMMAGIVVSNAVLMVDYTNLLRRRGVELHAAVIGAARTRLRPVLMTTAATLVGLLPMALGWGVGAETNAPLARAVIGGLAVSTVLTLFLVPTIYELSERRFPRRLPGFDDGDDDQRA
ncbi:MAG: efflux RND transporter permease subunit [Deltaproteobacteria bacterium]|jgi:multidrug efflux pump subunit AcrB|nr:efflux RND transporter permease subunit [Deltaproteobacteria bacterium]